MNAILDALRRAGLLPEDNRRAVTSTGTALCVAVRDGVASLPRTELLLMLGLLAMSRL